MNIIVRVIQNCLVKPEKTSDVLSVALKKIIPVFFLPVSLCLKTSDSCFAQARRSLDVAQALRGELRKKTSPLRGMPKRRPTDWPIVTSNEVRNEMKLYEEALSCAQEAEEELWKIFFCWGKNGSREGVSPRIAGSGRGIAFFFFSKFTWKKPKISSCEFRDVFFFGFG